MRTLLLIAALASCTKSSPASPDGPGAVDAPADSDISTVTFTYTPGWDGVVSVDVIGAFGQATDWTAPFVSLTASGATFTGTATLPPGTYDYVFQVVGDAAAGAKAATDSRYSIDPTVSAYQMCPAASPTATGDPNPCSQLAVPGTGADPLFHVRGTIVADGAPAASYLVVLERDEVGSHHYFGDRVTTAADGTYDIMAAAGEYRILVEHPLYESKNDAQLTPSTSLRRTISSPFAVAADVTISNAEVAFHDYASFAPQTTGTPLPTTFTFGTTSGLPTHLDVYGTAMAGGSAEIGDPWFSSMPTTLTGSAAFNGTFTTAQATETAVATGERYFWGVEQPHPADNAGIVWTGQSMVYAVTWH